MCQRVFFFCAKYTLEGLHTRSIEINSHITVLFVSLNERELSKRASAVFFLRGINPWRRAFSVY